MNSKAKGTVNIVAYGYINNIVGTIGDDIIYKNRACIISNRRVELLLAEREIILVGIDY